MGTKHEVPESHGETRKQSVLVIDDDRALAGILGQFLAEYGLEVLAAATGEAGLTALRARGVPLP